MAKRRWYKNIWTDKIAYIEPNSDGTFSLWDATGCIGYVTKCELAKHWQACAVRDLRAGIEEGPMTTYHTDPNAGLPAPSDAELAAADTLRRNKARRMAQQVKLDFDQFTASIGITVDYAGWCAFCKDAKWSPMTRDAWWTWLDRYLMSRDAKDQADTPDFVDRLNTRVERGQASEQELAKICGVEIDDLYADLHDDSTDERHDPHLDALI